MEPRSRGVTRNTLQPLLPSHRPSDTRPTTLPYPPPCSLWHAFPRSPRRVPATTTMRSRFQTQETGSCGWAGAPAPPPNGKAASRRLRSTCRSRRHSSPRLRPKTTATTTAVRRRCQPHTCHTITCIACNRHTPRPGVQSEQRCRRLAPPACCRSATSSAVLTGTGIHPAATGMPLRQSSRKVCFNPGVQERRDAFRYVTSNV